MEWIVIHKVNTEVKRCVHCREDHKITFKQFQNDVSYSGFNYWAMCPNTLQPILMKIVEESPEEV